MEVLNPIKIKSNRQIYLANYFKKYNSEKINCECGSSVVKTKIYQHKQTKKHLNFLNQK